MKTQHLIAYGALAIGIIYTIFQVLQPNPDLLRFDVQGNRAYGYGYTNDHSVHQITKFLDRHPEVDTLVLKRMSGTRDSDMNLRLARHIRKRGLNTHLEHDSIIASGAVDLFLAGVKRTMECGAHIGVHSWSVGDSYYPARLNSDPEQKKHERFLQSMGIDPAFYTYTRDAAAPSDIHYMNVDDIQRFGLLTETLECE